MQQDTDSSCSRGKVGGVGQGQGQSDVICGLCGMFELRQVRVNANVVNVQPKIEFELELGLTGEQQQHCVGNRGGEEWERAGSVC